jgi:Family of unknown function (DUF695)
VTSAPVWSVVRLEQAQQSLTCRVRTDPGIEAARGSHQVLIWITVSFLHTRGAGLPTADEVTSLDEVEQHLTSLLADRGLLVATVSGADVREYVVYADTTAWSDELRHDLNVAIAPHIASAVVQEDAHWASYRRLLG